MNWDALAAIAELLGATGALAINYLVVFFWAQFAQRMLIGALAPAGP